MPGSSRQFGKLPVGLQVMSEINDPSFRHFTRSVQRSDRRKRHGQSPEVQGGQLLGRIVAAGDAVLPPNAFQLANTTPPGPLHRLIAAVIRRQVSAPSWSPSAAISSARVALCSRAFSPYRFSIRVAARQISISGITPGNRTLAVGIRLTPITAWVTRLRVKVAIDGSDI